jgi:transcriptional regulator with XRE-family HTH domain
MTGEYIRAKIIMSGYQQVEVAEKLGITPQNLESRLKSKEIKVSFLLAVAKAINKNVYYFFNDSLEKKNSDFDFEDVSDDGISDEKTKKVSEDFILSKIAEVLSSKLTPHFDVSQKSIDVLAESQSRILLNQGEVLDKIEELLSIIVEKRKVK